MHPTTNQNHSKQKKKTGQQQEHFGKEGFHFERR